MLLLGSKRQKYSSVGVWAAADGSSQSLGRTPSTDAMCIDLFWPQTKSVEENRDLCVLNDVGIEIYINIMQKQSVASLPHSCCRASRLFLQDVHTLFSTMTELHVCVCLLMLINLL